MNDLKVYESGDRANQSIIFVHGFPFSHNAWKNQVDALSKNYHCVTYDIRGLGNSKAGDGQYTMESYVDDLLNVIQDKDLKKPIICGHSMGGYITFRAIQRDQGLFKGAILCNTGTAPDNNEGKLKRASIIKEINGNSLENFADVFLEKAFSKEFIGKYPQVISAWKKEIVSSDPIGIKGALLAMVSRTDTTEYLEKITIPTLFVCGVKDEIIPAEVMVEMSKKVHNSQSILVENASHMTAIEAPKEVNSAIKEFLEEIK